MNVFVILALCVNLVSLGNAVNDINFATILSILKSKHRQDDYSNIQETDDPVEVVPIIPGFYLEKPTDMSKSLYENPEAWPDDVFGNVNNDATRQSNTKTRANTRYKGTSDDYLNGKILKAVRSLNKFRETQKKKKKSLKNTIPYLNSGNVRKDQVVDVLGRMFKGIKGNIHFRGEKINKKPPKMAIGSSDVKKLGDLLKKFMNGNANSKYSINGKHAYFETEEQTEEDEGILEDILNNKQNNNQNLETQGQEIHQTHPNLIVIATAPLRDDELEMENNAKESMDFYDGDFSKTRRADIGGGNSSALTSSGESDDSSYERNPGNPYTVHKNKYKQNWPYNHYMDGDHMNINPLGPQFGAMGPSGAEIFFGRKWWYFNQDDFKPMG